MDNEFKHTFVTDYDCREGLVCMVQEGDLLWDIKKLLSEYYAATFNHDGTALNILFNNGQRFCVSVTEKKSKSA